MKTFLRKQLFVIVVIGFALSLSLFLYLTGRFYTKSVPIRSIQGDSTQASNGLPMRLKIPSIKVDAAIEHLSLTSEGAMAAPEGFDNVAWFSLGPRPGQIGSALIAGHRSWINGKAAVFDNLDKLKKGDNLYIEDDKGTSISFVVRESRTYNPEEDVPDVFYQSNGNHLNLIASAGDWDNSQKSATKRLVVFADIIY